MTVATNSLAAAITGSMPTPAAIRPVSAIDSGAHSAPDFGETLSRALHSVDSDQRSAEDKMAAVDSGRSDDLVGAMLASQQASVSFSMLLQVRNKIVGAVDDLLKLQL